MKKLVLIGTILLLAASCSRQQTAHVMTNYGTQGECEHGSKNVCIQISCIPSEAEPCSDIREVWEPTSLSMNEVNSIASNPAGRIPLNWKTYTNARLKFSVQYPSAGEIVEDGDLVIIKPAKGLMPLTIEPSLVADPVFEPKSMEPGANPICAVSTTVFAGYKAERCDSTRNSEAGSRIRLLDLPNSNWTKNNEIRYGLPSEYTYLVTVYDQVLSTIKFVK